ncbi:MAG: protein-glutamine glutaminase family protein [Methylocystis sp.]
MTAPAVDGYSLKILLGGRNETIFEDYLFRRIATTGGGDVAIYKRDGAALTRPGNTEPLSYRFADFNCESWWDNHIAPTLLVREDEDGPASTVVIDPEIGESPLSPSEWRARQDSLDLTCLIAIDWSGVASIDRTCSSRETLDAMIDANRRRHGDECNDSDLIAFLSDGEILDAHFDNPYDPRLSEGEVRSSTLEIFEHFGAWLAPLAAFKRWRARAIAATIEVEKARDRL